MDSEVQLIFDVKIIIFKHFEPELLIMCDLPVEYYKAIYHLQKKSIPGKNINWKEELTPSMFLNINTRYCKIIECHDYHKTVAYINNLKSPAFLKFMQVKNLQLDIFYWLDLQTQIPADVILTEWYKILNYQDSSLFSLKFKLCKRVRRIKILTTEDLFEENEHPKITNLDGNVIGRQFKLPFSNNTKFKLSYKGSHLAAGYFSSHHRDFICLITSLVFQNFPIPETTVIFIFSEFMVNKKKYKTKTPAYLIYDSEKSGWVSFKTQPENSKKILISSKNHHINIQNSLPEKYLDAYKTPKGSIDIYKNCLHLLFFEESLIGILL